jgi:hypothetical protein
MASSSYSPLDATSYHGTEGAEKTTFLTTLSDSYSFQLVSGRRKDSSARGE